MRLEEVEPFISGVEPVEPLWKGEEKPPEVEIPVEEATMLGGLSWWLRIRSPLLAMPSPALTVKVTVAFTWLEPAEPAQPPSLEAP